MGEPRRLGPAGVDGGGGDAAAFGVRCLCSSGRCAEGAAGWEWGRGGYSASPPRWDGPARRIPAGFGVGWGGVRSFPAGVTRPRFGDGRDLGTAAQCRGALRSSAGREQVERGRLFIFQLKIFFFFFLFLKTHRPNPKRGAVSPSPSFSPPPSPCAFNSGKSERSVLCWGGKVALGLRSALHSPEGILSRSSRSRQSRCKAIKKIIIISS